MWSNYLRVFELVILYGVPLFESLEALKKDSGTSKLKKWAVFWAIQFLLNSLGAMFSFLSNFVIRILHLAFTVWLYHPTYNGSLYISEVVDKIAPRSIDVLLRDGPLSSLKLIEPEPKPTPNSMAASRVTRSYVRGLQKPSRRKNVTLFQLAVEIVAVFAPGLFWQYKQWSPEELTQLDGFLTNFDKELRALLLEPTLEGNYRLLCEKVGTCIHPSLVERKKNPEFKQLAEDGYGEKYAIFLNHRVDVATLKLLSYVLPIVKVNSLKFSNNSLSEDELKAVAALINKDESVTTVFFEWNPLGAFPQSLQTSFVCGLLRPTVTNLILRSSSLGDAIVKELVSKILSNADCKLKYLDLYDNALTGECSQSLSKLLEENRSIEYLGLSKNNFAENETLQALFNSIGNIKLSAEEYQSYKKLEKDRDEVLERNKKKKKGAPDEPVPFLLKVQEIDGQWYYSKNSKLRGITLGWCKLKKDNTSLLKSFVQRVNKNEKEPSFELVLTGNDFSKIAAEELKELPGIKI